MKTEVKKNTEGQQKHGKNTTPARQAIQPFGCADPYPKQPIISSIEYHFGRIRSGFFSYPFGRSCAVCKGFRPPFQSHNLRGYYH